MVWLAMPRLVRYGGVRCGQSGPAMVRSVMVGSVKFRFAMAMVNQRCDVNIAPLISFNIPIVNISPVRLFQCESTKL